MSFTGEIEKTEWVIQSPKFGRRRVWKDGIGFFYVVNNIAYRHYEGDDYEVFKAERVQSSVPLPSCSENRPTPPTASEKT